MDAELNLLAVGTVKGHSVVPLVKLLLEAAVRDDAGDLADLAGLHGLVALLLADKTKDGFVVLAADLFVLGDVVIVVAALIPFLVDDLGLFNGDKVIVGDLHKLLGPGCFELVDPQGVPAIHGTHVAGVLGVLAEPDYIVVGVLAFGVGALVLHHQCIEAVVLLEDDLADLTLVTSHAGQVNDIALAEQLSGLVGEDLIDLFSGPGCLGVDGVVASIGSFESIREGATSLTTDLVGEDAGLLGIDGVLHCCISFQLSGLLQPYTYIILPNLVKVKLAFCCK